MPTFAVETGTGSASATSYASVADADDYNAMHPDAATWSTLDTSAKQNRLMMASLLLDQRCRWVGDKAVAASGLRWPRIGVLDRDQRAVPYDSIPTALVYATAELARVVSSSAVYGGEARTVQSKSTGPASVTYADTGRTMRTLPEAVVELVAPYIDRTARVARA